MAADFYDLYCEAIKENEILRKENANLKMQIKSLTNRIAYLEKNQDKIIKKSVEKQVAKITEAFEEKVISLEKQVDHLKGILNNDSTNSGLSTSKTPLNKNKHIPNSRVKSDKEKGGQLNHKKYKLSQFEDSEITDIETHKIDVCPNCGSEMIETSNVKEKDELDFKIIVKKIRHRFIETICPSCGNVAKVNIPVDLKEENQYGKRVQALALSLMNEGYVSMNRTKNIISGLTNDEINLSEGYIAKLQKRLSNNLVKFNQELKREIIKLDIMHWDDTVIFVNKKRACLRFYGNNKVAYYTAHLKKDKDGIDKDGILLALNTDTKVVHDHNMVNYNDDYKFINVECVAHLLRDLHKCAENTQHDWPKYMVSLLINANIERNGSGCVSDPEYVESEYDIYVESGEEINEDDKNKYYHDEEKALLKRLKKYKENYLMWIYNADIPFTNNEAERSLRSSKTKMRVSGQFENIGGAENFASIKSYIETGKRHGMNSFDLIESALYGNYVTAEEMKNHDQAS